MKKFIILIIFTLIPVISFSTVSAQTTEQNQNTACNNKSNGQDCSYQAQLYNQNPEPANISGKCDRKGNGTLYCNNTLTGWEDCFNKSQPNDACKNSSSQLGTCQRQGNGDNFTCDITTTPPSNPGGISPSPGDGPCQDCGGSKCNAGQVCAQDGTQKKCVEDKGSAGKCGASPCSPGQVCVQDGTQKKCVQNQCPGGGGAGNGGGGTPPPGTGTPPASSPQTVSFINPSRFNSIIELVAGVINALLGILGAITVAVLVKSGFEYMISSDPGAVGKALDGIKNAIVGLMIIMGAFLITQYVISALAG